MTQNMLNKTVYFVVEIFSVIFVTKIIKNQSLLIKKLSVCQGIRICTICNKTVRVNEEKHECGKTFCKICKGRLPTNHFCYVQPIEPSKNSKSLFFFYDFETQQCESVEDDDKIRMHVPNLCVVQQVCNFRDKNIDISTMCMLILCGKE